MMKGFDAELSAGHSQPGRPSIEAYTIGLALRRHWVELRRRLLLLQPALLLAR